MSNFTTEVRYICCHYAGVDESTYSAISESIENSRADIFGSYPIFDENYRDVLETKILKHYYTREIGSETVPLWLFRLNTKMNEIMPYYNKLYESELIKFDPFFDYEMVRTSDRNESVNKVNDIEKDVVKDQENSSVRGATKNNENELVKNDVRGKTNTIQTNTDNKEHSEESNVAGKLQTNSISENNSSNGKTENNASAIAQNKTNDDKSHTDLYSDTPQGGLGNIQNADNMYLTNFRKINENEAKEENKAESTNAQGTSSYSENKQNTSKSENTETGSQTNDGTSSQNLTSNANEQETFVSGENATKKENITENKNEQNTEKEKHNTKENGNVNSLEKYIEQIKGKRSTASFSKYLEEFRKTFLNIDMMIINELEPLFFGLWE